MIDAKFEKQREQNINNIGEDWDEGMVCIIAE